MSEEITEDIKELVIARLETISPSKKISIGDYGEFTKDELIKEVKCGSEIGKKMVKIELGFLRALKQGIIR